MDREDINMINFCLVLTFLIANVIFIICNTNFKCVVIVETISIPFLYLLFYIIGKLVDKGIL